MKSAPFISAIAAAAIALTASIATPAAAGDRGDTLAKILIGAAVVGIAASVIHNKNKRRRQAVTQYDTYRPNPAYRPYQPRVVYQQRPKTCLRQRYTNYGWKTYYSRKCLDRYYSQRNSQYNQRNNRYVATNGYRYNTTYNNTYNQGDDFNEYMRDADNKR